jgi:GGDEF domain-containing protein
MGMLNRKELDHLERRELQLTILAAVIVLVLAGGLAVFMYPLVFLHPVGNKWTLRVAFFGFCGLTLLFVGYLLERQRTVRRLKQQILAELERNVTLQQQASVDLLQSMPDQNHFWDRLTMEYRRAMTMQKTLSLLLVKAKPVAASAKSNEKDSTAWSDAAKAMSRKLRPTDSIYRLAADLFALVLPETDTLNAKRVAVRLQEELQEVRAKHGKVFEITVHNYPEHAQSSHELEDIVKFLLPSQDEWAALPPAAAPAPAAVPVPTGTKK